MSRGNYTKLFIKGGLTSGKTVFIIQDNKTDEREKYRKEGRLKRAVGGEITVVDASGNGLGRAERTAEAK